MPRIYVATMCCNTLSDKKKEKLNKYYENFIEYKEEISIEEAKKEYMMLGLRKINGVNLNDYYLKFNSKIEDDFNLDKLFNLDLIEKIDGYLRIKKDKILLGNIVFEEFVG